MTPRGHEFRLEDICAHIEKIEFAGEKMLEAEKYRDDKMVELIFNSIIYCLLVIGEAVKDLDSEMKNRHSHIPWKDIVGLRDLLAHQYFTIETQVIRKTIGDPLKQLHIACLSELK